MATSVTSYVDVKDCRNAPDPEYFTAPNTWQILTTMRPLIQNYGYGSLMYRYTNGVLQQFKQGTPSSAIFNQPVKMSNNETRADCMFGSGTISAEYNTDVTTYEIYPSSSYYSNTPLVMSSTYVGAFFLYNSEVIMSNNVTNCYCMFSDCVSYNRPMDIPSKVENCAGMFRNCYSYNSSVKIGSNVDDCYEMFCNCVRFNRSIDVTQFNFQKPVNLGGMFHNCIYLNNASILSGFLNNVKNSTNCLDMFSGCYNLHANIDTLYVRGACKNYSNMFNHCDNIHINNIYINSFFVGSNVNDNRGNITYMFNWVKNNTPSNIYIKSSTSQLIQSYYDVIGFLGGKDSITAGGPRVNIFLNGISPTYFTGTGQNSILAYFSSSGYSVTPGVSWVNSGGVWMETNYGITIQSASF